MRDLRVRDIDYGKGCWLMLWAMHHLGLMLAVLRGEQLCRMKDQSSRCRYKEDASYDAAELMKQNFKSQASKRPGKK